MPLIQSILEEPRKAFTQHLEDKNNVRILFSGAYGSGKTTFLNENFKEEIQVKTFGEKKYKTIHLYPVSYPAASNEDIFKYIKYDILFHLIVNYELVLMEEDLGYLSKIPGFLTSHVDKIISTSLLFIPENNDLGVTGDDASKTFEILSSFGKSLYKLIADRKSSPQPNSDINNFLKNINEAEGSIYEENIITQLIYASIQKLKDNEVEKEPFETILIIDDLDRIDPHHIFRLFNVFAAHFDSRRELPNKFGFDKVMFVCDINNIRNIYRTNYGTGTDFTGYIDKFYSKKIFNFSNKESVKEAVKTVVVKSLNFQGQDKGLTEFLTKEKNLTEDMERFLSAFVQYNTINLRALFRYLENEPIQIRNKIINFDGEAISNYQLTGALVLDILLNIFGDLNAVEEALEACSQSFVPELSIANNYRVGNALTILGYQKHKFNDDKYEVAFPELEYCLRGTLKREFGRPVVFWTNDVKVFSLDGTKELEIKPNMFYFHLKALQLLKRLQYFD